MEHPKLLIVDWVNALLAPVLGPLLEPLGVHTSPEHPYLIPPHIVMTIVIVAGVIAFGFFLRSRLSVENPGKLQILAEDGLNMMGSMLDEWIPGKGRQYMPLLLAVFLYILISNYAGLIPGLMAPIMLPIELISHLSRVMSLSLRLFGNIFGEELVIAVLFSLIPFFVPLPMMFLGLVTGGLQAFIFVLLTTIYLAGAVAIEHHDEHEAHDAPHDDRVDVGQGHAAATA